MMKEHELANKRAKEGGKRSAAAGMQVKGAHEKENARVLRLIPRRARGEC